MAGHLTLLLRGAALALLQFPTTASSQAPAVRLSGNGITLSHEFERLGSARELDNGVLIAIDKGSLFRIDFETNTVRQIGRTGSGPEEYRELGRLNCAPDDSSLVNDPQLGRWIMLKGDGIVASESIVDRFGYNPVLVGADRFGRVLEVRPFKYGQSTGLPRLPLHTAAESLLVIVDHRTSARRDTVARVRGAFRGLKKLLKPVTPGGSPIPWIVQNPFAIEDQAVLFCDGWIAMVRGNPYSVEWIPRSGQRSASAALPFARVRVSAAEMKAATEAEHGSTFTPQELAPWPDLLPPFTKTALLPMNDGRLAIRRIASAAAPGTVYDIVDRTGRLSVRLELKPRESVLAFGAKSVYVISTDPDGVQSLTRYAWSPN